MLYEHKKLTDREYFRSYTYNVDLSYEIGRRIKLAREKMDLTLAGLEAHTKSLSKSRISNWEQGTRRPGVEEARELAEVRGVSAAWLLCLDDESTLSERERTLLLIFRQTDRRGKSAIFSIAEAQTHYISSKKIPKNTSS